MDGDFLLSIFAKIIHNWENLDMWEICDTYTDERWRPELLTGAKAQMLIDKMGGVKAGDLITIPCVDRETIRNNWRKDDIILHHSKPVTVSTMLEKVATWRKPSFNTIKRPVETIKPKPEGYSVEGKTYLVTNLECGLYSVPREEVVDHTAKIVWLEYYLIEWETEEAVVGKIRFEHGRSKPHLYQLEVVGQVKLEYDGMNNLYQIGVVGRAKLERDEQHIKITPPNKKWGDLILPKGSPGARWPKLMK